MSSPVPKKLKALIVLETLALAAAITFGVVKHREAAIARETYEQSVGKDDGWIDGYSAGLRAVKCQATRSSSDEYHEAMAAAARSHEALADEQLRQLHMNAR